jgi:hypothetical protein
VVHPSPPSRAIYFLYYNFCRGIGHQTVRVTPAMDAGLANTVWTIQDMVRLMEPKSLLDGLYQAG